MGSIADMVATAIHEGRQEREQTKLASAHDAPDENTSQTAQRLKQAAQELRTSESEGMLSEVAALLESLH